MFYIKILICLLALLLTGIKVEGHYKDFAFTKVDDDQMPIYRINTRKEYDALGCTGHYVARHLKTLNRVCEDCWNLYRRDEVLRRCRQNCFRSEWFQFCTASLLEEDNLEGLNRIIDAFNGKSVASK